ncbi:MAG: 30S ribosomal protein S20 [Patescibacteria group bacterium]|nr:30S ribosomal protein S20 [Patescibacteria group bacterium]
MPQTTSAKKALRTSKRNRSLNLIYKKNIKDTKKKIRQITSGQIKSDLKKAVSAYYKAIDKAAKVHIMHKNKAARLKSQAAKILVAKPETAKKEVKKAKNK